MYLSTSLRLPDSNQIHFVSSSQYSKSEEISCECRALQLKFANAMLEDLRQNWVECNANVKGCLLSKTLVSVQGGS